MMRRVRFQGRTRNGAGTVGVATVPDLPVWVESKYRAGWRELSALTDEEEVGGIGPDPSNDHRRIWWASGDDTLADDFVELAREMDA